MAGEVIGELVWKITGDDSGLNKSIGKSEKTVSKFGGSLKKLGGIAAAAFSVQKIVQFGGSLISAASNAEETANKFGVVFSSLRGEADSMAENLRKNFGLSGVAAQQLLSDTGDLLSGFGFSQKEALKLSGQLNVLAVDLASFTNYSGGAAGASQALTKALLGEREQIKSLGISITEADIKQLAKDKGIVGELDRQTKAALTLELAVKQSKNAIGDFARSQYSFANQMRIANANTEDLKVTLGQGLLPFATLAVTEFNKMAGESQSVAESFRDYVTSADGAARISKILAPIIANVYAYFSVLGSVFDEIKAAFAPVIDDLVELSDEMGEAGIFTAILGAQGRVLVSVLRIMGKGFALNIGILKNLVLATIDTAKAFGDMFAVIKGEKSFKELDGSFAKIGRRLTNLASEAKDDYLELGRTISNELSSAPGEIIDSAEETARKTAEQTENIYDRLYDSLTAKQEEFKSKTVENANSTVKGVEDSWDKLKPQQKIEELNNAFSTVFNNLYSLFTNITGLINATLEQNLAALEVEKQATLERAGLAEETTEQQLLADIKAAEKAGDAETKAEKEKELARLKIIQDFDKQKAALEYDAALRSWELQRTQAQIQLITAPLNALASTLAWAKFPGGLALAGLNAGLAAAGAGAYYAQLLKTKPIPAFADGGIVPGTSYTGDNVLARLNSGEVVLNQDQQNQLLNLANGGGSGNIKIYIGSDLIYDNLYKASKNGELIIDSRGIV